MSILPFRGGAGRSRSRIGSRLVLPIAGIVGLALAFSLGGALLIAKRQDRAAVEASIRLADVGRQRLLTRLSRSVLDYAFWDDAVRNLDTALDPEWADVNVAEWVAHAFGHDRTLVIDHDGRPAYAWSDGARADADAAVPLVVRIAPLLERAARAPIDDSQPEAGFIRDGGAVYVVAVSAITPDDRGLRDAITARGGRRAQLVFLDRVDEGMLASVAADYALADLRLADASAPGDGRLVLVSPSGEPIGALTWQVDHPGGTLLASVLPGLAAAAAGLFAFTLVMLAGARRAALAIEESERRFRDVAEASSDWIWETDDQLRLTFVSDRFVAVAGGADGSLAGRRIDEVLGRPDDARLPSDAEAATVDDPWQAARERRPFRDLHVRHDGSAGQRFCRLAGKPVFAADGRFRGYRGAAADVTAEVEANRVARHLVLHDHLTGLPNRLLLKDRLEQAIASSRRNGGFVAVLGLDLDRFKAVNDTLGHAAGDALLEAAAARLLDTVRGTDTVARTGGDEFTVIQVGMSQPHGATALCARLHETFRAPFDVGGAEVFVGVSIGIALAPVDSDDAETLMKQADIALYRAKADGRGTFRCFEAEMDAHLNDRKALEHDLRRALAKGAIDVHYQPLIDVATGAVLGVEALARWPHPTRGMVSPERFIAIAEETGLILPLGEFVLRKACSDVRDRRDLRLSVNLSPVQFRHPNLAGLVAGVLAGTGLEASRLQLEITEGVLVQDSVAALATLRRLKALGVSVAMDDFGTGYSSLGYLQRFEFDTIKIDRSFTGRLHASRDAEAIVRAVIGLGQSLGMRTIAEGVETAAQLAFLRASGCDEAQGYLFSKPVPASALADVLDAVSALPATRPAGCVTAGLALA
ncbi:bifunctional diguanylate cyclase/phosphodiesterase [Marinivivus vitaminiproducens]|uniref:bifunctional diguanylate cyclase/phosphodiesterase n=1 Tax=Marinivivus vitaminiproducens TaxID=3035935 RepID=UPI00279A748D|nr:EAL domain-containing protein [Geminicoccaceae bacterium SCSIO 64248]